MAISKKLYVKKDLASKEQAFIDQLCEDSNAEVRLNACEALQAFPIIQTENRFLQLLRDSDELVQCQACQALASSKSKHVLKALITTACDSSGMLRGYAVASLADVQRKTNGNAKETITFLSELLNEETDDWVRIAIYRSLIVLGIDKYESEFLSHRKDSDYHNRCLLLNLLEEMLDEGLWKRTENLQSMLLDMYAIEDTLAVKETIEKLLRKTEDGSLS